MAVSDKEKNIQIPISLFNRIVELMDSLDTSNFDAILLIMFNAVQYGLRDKRIRMMHRENFADVVCAEDDVTKRAALDNYINTKSWYKNN